MITCLTVLKSGGEFNASHVIRLRDQVAEHAPGWQFTCLTDMAPDCETVPLEHEWPGWWSKLELFRYEPLTGDALVYFDLDTTIVGDLAPVGEAALGSPWLILENCYRPGQPGSGVMAWSDDSLRPLYEKMAKRHGAIMAANRGDQDFVRASVEDETVPRPRFFSDVLPGGLMSYKREYCAKPKPDMSACSVVYFHGQPRPWGFGGIEVSK